MQPMGTPRPRHINANDSACKFQIKMQWESLLPKWCVMRESIVLMLDLCCGDDSTVSGPSSGDDECFTFPNDLRIAHDYYYYYY